MLSLLDSSLLIVFFLDIINNRLYHHHRHHKNMFSELIVTGDYLEAFSKADYLLLMTNLNVADRKVFENVQNLEHVFIKVKPKSACILYNYV